MFFLKVWTRKGLMDILKWPKIFNSSFWITNHCSNTSWLRKFKNSSKACSLNPSTTGSNILGSLLLGPGISCKLAFWYMGSPGSSQTMFLMPWSSLKSNVFNWKRKNESFTPLVMMHCAARGRFNTEPNVCPLHFRASAASWAKVNMAPTGRKRHEQITWRIPAFFTPLRVSKSFHYSSQPEKRISIMSHA